MKAIFKYTFVGLLAGMMLTTTSCSEDQLTTVPTQSMSGQGLLANGKAALVALNGIYREMYTSGWSTTGNTHQCFGITAYNLCADVMGEDHVMAAQGSGWFWFDALYNVKGRYTHQRMTLHDVLQLSVRQILQFLITDKHTIHIVVVKRMAAMLQLVVVDD